MLEIMKKAGTNKSNTRDFQFWLHHNHPIELSTNEMIEQRIDYIHNNPVEEGFVDDPAAWIFSSARDYAGTKGILDIYFLD